MNFPMNYTIHYTPEKKCKWYRKDKKKDPQEFCFLSPKHRNLNRCKICQFGHYCRKGYNPYRFKDKPKKENHENVSNNNIPLQGEESDIR